MIWAINEVVLLATTAVIYLIVIEIGFNLGRRRGSGDDQATISHFGALQNALLGLLALLLGFTIAMSLTRFETRKDLVVAEANAIGTTYLRAQFLPEQQKREVSRLLNSYVAARLEFFKAGIDETRLEAANTEASKIKSRLWTAAVTSSQTANNPIMVSMFIQSLNDVIDVGEKRQVALENHVPETVIGLLFLVSAAGLGFIGYGSGLTGTRHLRSTTTFAILVALVLSVILDIDRPRRGLIQVSQASMVRLQKDLAANRLSNN